MENKNWIENKLSVMENSFKSLDDNLSIIAPYRSGKSVGEKLSGLIDSIVDGLFPKQ